MFQKHFLPFFLSLTFGALAWGKPVSQFIYEDIKNIRCDEASNTELSELGKNSRCSQYTKTENFLKIASDMDKATEATFFSALATRQLDNLTCAEADLTALQSSQNLRNELTTPVCENLNSLRAAQENLEKTDTWIQRYKKVNDRSLRVIPEADYKKNQQILLALEAHKKSINAVIGNLKSTTVLFKYDTVFNFVTSQLSKNKTPQEICENLKTELPILLRKTALEVRDSQARLAKGLKSPGDMPNSMKEVLWNSSQGDELFKDLAQNSATSKGLLCRMNARYGEGAELRDGLERIGPLALPPFLKLTERLAAAFYASRAGVPLMLSRVLLMTELGVGAAINGDAIKRSCFDKAPGVLSSGENKCAKDPQAASKNLLSQQSAGSCVFAASLGAVSTYFGASALDKSLKGLVPPKILVEMATYNDKLSDALSLRGAFDVIEVARVEQKEIGKIVTVVRKKNESEWVKNADDRLKVKDPVADPNDIVDSLGPAASKFGYTSTKTSVSLPDAKYLARKIQDYNDVADPSKKIGISFYETNKIQDSESYVKRFIEDGSLPMGKAGEASSSFFKTGHVHLHDVTLHSAMTIPNDAIKAAQTSYKTLGEFQKFLKDKAPDVYASAQKEKLFESLADEMSRNIDMSTGSWSHMVSNMLYSDVKAAVTALELRNLNLAAAQSPRELIESLTFRFKENPKVQNELEKFLQTKTKEIDVPTYPGQDLKTPEDTVKFLFQRHLDMVKSMSNTNF